MTNVIGRALEQTIYAVKEDVTGTLKQPTASDAALMIVGAGYAEMNQQPAFTNSENIANSLDILERFQDMTGAGTWSIPMYASPSGAGSKPMGAILFESLQGVETVSATSVTYSQATTKPSFSLWAQRGHTLFFARGATVSSAAPTITNKGGMMFNFSGSFMEMGWAGTSTVNGAVTTDTDVTVATGTGKYYTAGALVDFGTLGNNSNDGYLISSVSGDVVTLSESVTLEDGESISGFLPSLTPVGTPLENRKTSITIAGVAADIKSVDVTFNSPVVYQENEISTTGYPKSYIEDKRDISGTINLVFKSEDVKYFYDGNSGASDIAVIITIGTSDGYILEIDFPYCQLEVPSISTDGPALALAIGIAALGDGVGENSATFTFK